jgi:hypothetical protein
VCLCVQLAFCNLTATATYLESVGASELGACLLECFLCHAVTNGHDMWIMTGGCGSGGGGHCQMQLVLRVSWPGLRTPCSDCLLWQAVVAMRIESLSQLHSLWVGCVVQPTSGFYQLV